MFNIPQKITNCFFMFLVVLLSVAFPVVNVCALDLPPLPETGKQHYVIYREGYRNNRIEFTAFNINNDGQKNIIYWNGELQLHYNQNYMDDEKWFLDGDKWTKFQEDHWCISNNATEVIESDLQVIDCRDGVNLGIIDVVKKEENTTPYERFWDGNNYMSFKETDEGIVLICSEDGIGEIMSVPMPEELVRPKRVISAGDNIIILQREEFVELDIYGKRFGDYGNSPVIVLDRNYNVADIKYISGLTEYERQDETYIFFRNTDYSQVRDESGNLVGDKIVKFYKTQDGINWEEVNSSSIPAYKNLKHNNFTNYNLDYIGGRAGWLLIPQNDLTKDYNVILENNNGLTPAGNVKTAKYNVFLSFENLGTYCYDESGSIKRETRRRVQVTLDGINSVELPTVAGEPYWYETGSNISRETMGHFWCTNDYLYIDASDKEYYRIPLDFWRRPIIVLDNSVLGFKHPIFIENDRTLIPMRFLFEQMGADVSWDETTNTATVSKASDVVSFSIDNLTATVNAQPKTMDVPARLINDKTYIPLRFLSEELGYTVEWDEELNTVIITE